MQFWQRLEDDLRTLIASGFDLEHYNRLEEKALAPRYTPALDVEAAVNGRQECQRSLQSVDFECAPAGDGIPPEGVLVDEKDEHPNAPVTSRLGDAPPLEPAFEGKLSLRSHREGQDRLPHTAPADKSGFSLADGTQPTQCDWISKFGESIRDLLRESPMKFKDLYPAIAQRYPFFRKSVVTTADGKEIELIDGGYCANNPTLYAIADAVKALQKENSDLRVVSLGVGMYPEPEHWHSWIKRCFVTIQLLQKTLNVNTASMGQLRSILFKDVRTVRINDHFERPEMATDLLESNLKKLNMLYQRGGESFAKYEDELKEIMGVAPLHAKAGDN